MERHWKLWTLQGISSVPQKPGTFFWLLSAEFGFWWQCHVCDIGWSKCHKVTSSYFLTSSGELGKHLGKVTQRSQLLESSWEMNGKRVRNIGTVMGERSHLAPTPCRIKSGTTVTPLQKTPSLFPFFCQGELAVLYTQHIKVWSMTWGLGNMALY